MSKNYEIPYRPRLPDVGSEGDTLNSPFQEQQQAAERFRQELYTTPRSDAPARTIAGRGHGEKPFEAVSYRGDRGWAVGPHDLTADMIYDWLADAVGRPPDRERLRALVKQGKLTPKLSASIRCGRLDVLLEKMKNGSQPLPLEMQELLPKKFQKTIASDLTRKYGFLENSDVGWQSSDADRPGYRADLRSRILTSAYDCIGEALWRDGRFKASRLDFGRLACADAVTGIMLRAGIPGVFSSGVPGIERDVLRLGGRIVSEPRPGDIVVGYREAGQSHHVGVVGENGSVIHNSSARRQVVQGDLRGVFNRGHFQEIKFLRLPANA